jgi:hypothetical protein
LVRYLYAGKESTSYAGGGTTTGIKVTSINENIDRGIFIEEDVSSYIGSSGYGGALKLSGDAEGSLRPLQMDCIIEALLGTKTPNLDGDYEYTIGYPGSVQIDIGESNATISRETDYVGCIIKSGSFSFEPSEAAKFSFDWIASDYSQTTYASPTYTTEEPVMFWSASVSIDGTPSTMVKSLTLDINRNINEDAFVVGSFNYPRITLGGMTEITASIEFSQDEFNEIKTGMFGSSSSSSVPATNDIGSMALIINCATPSGTDAIDISAPLTLYSNPSIGISGMDEATHSMEFKIVETTSSPFKITTYT